MIRKGKRILIPYISKIFKLIKNRNIILAISIALLAILSQRDNHTPNQAEYNIEPSNLVDQPQQQEKIETLSSIPKDSRIVIPKIFVDAPLLQGEEEPSLLKGMWNITETSTPDLGGNTVIAGHRMLHTKGPNTFYYLNVLALQDTILIYWEGKEYKYQVFDLSIVKPDQVEVLDNTDDSIITLITCTPRGTSEKRLIVKAKLLI
ncbi:sortase [Candidatus Dojkabacteria bacterium]|nr:sortase [Candidatus Dojkabacteria bacterium]